jgi:hypothetical protein
MMNENHNEKNISAAVVKHRKTTTGKQGYGSSKTHQNRPKFGMVQMQHHAAHFSQPSTLNQGA